MDFRFRGGDLIQRGVNVLGLDGELLFKGRRKPRSPRLQVERSRIAFAGLREQIDCRGREDFGF